MDHHQAFTELACPQAVDWQAMLRQYWTWLVSYATQSNAFATYSDVNS